MGYVRLRQFEWTVTGESGRLDAVVPRHLPTWLPVDLAQVLSVNALAVPLTKHALRYATRLHELRLLSSYLVDSGGPIVLRRAELSCSALHIRRFVSESTGLGMLTGVVQACLVWRATPDSVHHIDALPVSLAHRYPARGTRPDLLFRLASGTLLAGEARGRSPTAGRPPGSVLVEHRQRIASLLPWSRVHAPLVVTWAYLTETGTIVDLFTPSGGSHLAGPFGYRTPQPSDQSEVGIASGRHETSVSTERTSQPDQASPGMLFDSGLASRRELERALYETAPSAPITVAGRRLRGRWARSDLLGDDRGQLLLGVLDEPLSAEESASLTRRLRQRDDQRDRRVFTDGELQASAAVRGRILLTHDPEGERPAWELLED